MYTDDLGSGTACGLRMSIDPGGMRRTTNGWR
jgi:hypothetical protein